MNFNLGIYVDQEGKIMDKNIREIFRPGIRKRRCSLCREIRSMRKGSNHCLECSMMLEEKGFKKKERQRYLNEFDENKNTAGSSRN